MLHGILCIWVEQWRLKKRRFEVGRHLLTDRDGCEGHISPARWPPDVLKVVENVHTTLRLHVVRIQRHPIERWGNEKRHQTQHADTQLSGETTSHRMSNAPSPYGTQSKENLAKSCYRNDY